MTPADLNTIAEAYNKNREYDLYLAWISGSISNSSKSIAFDKLLPKKSSRATTTNTYNKYKMQDYEIDIHLNRYKKERKVLLIG